MKIEDIKVSIITPMHNDANFISETINSVLNQTHTNFELLLIDDASSDNTIQIVQSFLNDKRIKLICNEKNHGAAFSRNLGLKEATGEYVAFLDGDDLWNSTKLEKQLAFMIQNNYLFSCTYYEIIDETSKFLGKYVTCPPKITHKMFMRSCYIGCLTAMYRREVYENLQIPDTILKRNDYALWLKISENADCFCLNEYLAMYRKRENSISSVGKHKLFSHHIFLFRTLYGFSKTKSLFYAILNTIYYLFRKKKYIKKIKVNR